MDTESLCILKAEIDLYTAGKFNVMEIRQKYGVEGKEQISYALSNSRAGLRECMVSYCMFPCIMSPEIALSPRPGVRTFWKYCINVSYKIYLTFQIYLSNNSEKCKTLNYS